MIYYLLILLISFSLVDIVYLRKKENNHNTHHTKINNRSKQKTGHMRIMGGNVIPITKIPYQVSISEKNVYLPDCGGAIISKYHVLTAAQCIDKDLKYDVVIGSVTLGVGKRVPVAKAYNHPKYKSNERAYDISVLKLEQELKFNAKVQSIALPKKVDMYKSGQSGLVSGFGSTEDGSTLSSLLKAVKVPIHTLATCKKFAFPYVPNTLCAGNYVVKTTACQGDFGGPLVVNKKLIGIVSYGVGCSIPKNTGVYTDVSKYIDFICGICRNHINICKPENRASKGSSKIPKISGGNEIPITKIPYQITVAERDVYLPICGGTIISKKHVLTASQCINTDTKYDVITGSATLGVGERIQVSKAKNHPKFNETSKLADISILTLAKKLKFSEKVSSIQLPKKNEKYKVGAKAQVSGFGTTGDGSVLSQNLRAVEIQIRKPPECKNLLGHSVPDTLCAGVNKESKNACQGDSGGPLTFNKKVIGLVSYGVGCGLAGNTGVYTDVAKYIDFIMKETNKLKI